MAENKNQHYVPKCHLRPFSIHGTGTAINLYNIRLDQGIQNASIRGQCSRSYFYGEDRKLETILQGMEGKYATTIAEIEQGPKEVSEDTSGFLREFAHLQYSRTAKAAERRRATFESMHEISSRPVKANKGVRIDEVDLSLRAMVLGNLWTWAKSRDTIDDLKVAIVRNETNIDFVTSDDPAVLTNRVHLQTLKCNSFGLISCGMQLFLPLTPKLALIAYDTDAYGAPNKRGNWIPISRPRDVLALNELQYLNCDANIYFQAWDDRDRIAAEYKEAAPRRLSIVHRLWVGIKVGENSEADMYRRATKEETTTLGTKIVTVSPVFPTPRHWFSGLRFREKVWGWFPATGTGLFRQVHAYAKRFEVRFRRVRVRPGLNLLTGSDGPETVLHTRTPDERIQEAMSEAKSKGPTAF